MCGNIINCQHLNSCRELIAKTLLWPEAGWPFGLQGVDFMKWELSSWASVSCYMLFPLCVCRGVWFQPEGETPSHHWLCCCRHCFSHLSHCACHRLQPVSYPKSSLERLHAIQRLPLIVNSLLFHARRGSDRTESEFTDKLQHYTSGHCK